MRIGLGLVVGCMLLVHSTRAEDGKLATPPDGQASPRAVNDPLPVDPGTPIDQRKNRYISFKPNNIAGQTARLEVTLTASFPHPGLVGTSWWVQAPVAPGSPFLPAGECVAMLGSQATAADIDWAAAGCTVLHVTGCPIEPTSDYDVRALAGADVSNALAVPTILQPVPKFWGDLIGSYNGATWTAPNGLTNLDDIVAIIKTWQVPGASFAVPLSVADFGPGNINLVVNYSDVFQCIQGFIGAQYSYGPADADGDCPDDPGVDGQDAEIRFVPIRSAPLGSPVGTLGDPINATFNGALGCWEVSVLAGVEVDIDLQALGWGTAVGSPMLGAIQATVMSAGYANDVGGDLNPKGWPDRPDDGAYQATHVCGGGGDGSPCTAPFDQACAGNGFCIPNPDWVMPDCAGQLSVNATSTLDYGWATAAVFNCAVDDTLVKTMGGLILEVPEDAAGTYLIDLNPDPNSSFMSTGTGAPITGITLTPACITIAVGPPCCLPDGSCTSLLSEDCAIAGGIQACECRGDDDMNGVNDACEADCDSDGILDIVELANCPPGDLSCGDCNNDCQPDGCEPDADGDGVSDACDNCVDVPNPGQEDQNGDGLGDACSGACCFVLDGNFSCLDTSEADCAALIGVTGVFQGPGTVCPTEGVGTQIHLGTVVTHVTDPAQLCGGGRRGGDCVPGDPIDPWQTATDAVMCHQFGVGPESPPIPADFFGPGSDPFTGQVCLEGQPLGATPFGDFGDADTLVRRTGGPAGTGDPFDRCTAPSGNEVTVNVEVVALLLVSTDPITVTYNGGQDPESWSVVVHLSDLTPPPGTITAVKTHCNGGTYNSELHVQPKFTFTKIAAPGTVAELDTGLAGIPFVTLTQDDDPHWTSDVSESLGLPSPICTDFHPGIEDTNPVVDCDCNANALRDDCDIESGTSQDCNENGTPDSCDIAGGGSLDNNDNGVPDECELFPPVLAGPPHDILKNRYISIDPRGASGTNPSNHHIRVEVVSSLVNGHIGSGPWWAGPPLNGNDFCATPCISVVTQTKPASEPDWSGCNTLHLTGCPIIPTTTYAIAAESGGVLSVAAFLDTQARPGPKWYGDCVGYFDGVVWSGPNGATSIDDAVAAIKTFQNCAAFNAAHLSVVDMSPNLNGEQINLLVSINDVFAIILGFQGNEFPGFDLTQCQ